MAASKKDYRGLSPAEQRAARDQRLAQQNVPNGEAGRRERKLLEHYAAAQDDLKWIVDNNAWNDLGFETFTGWYAAKVTPVVSAAGLRPTQEFALYVLDRVLADQEVLPASQRLIQKELAEIVGVPASTLRRLASRSLQAPNGAGGDLETKTADWRDEARSLLPAKTAAEGTDEDSSADGVEGVANPPEEAPASPSGDVRLRPSADGDVTPTWEGPDYPGIQPDSPIGRAMADAPAGSAFGPPDLRDENGDLPDSPAVSDAHTSQQRADVQPGPEVPAGRPQGPDVSDGLSHDVAIDRPDQSEGGPATSPADPPPDGFIDPATAFMNQAARFGELLDTADCMALGPALTPAEFVELESLAAGLAAVIELLRRYGGSR